MDNVHTCARCLWSVMHNHTYTHIKCLLLWNLRVFLCTLTHLYNSLFYTKPHLVFPQLHRNCHLRNVKKPSVVYYSKSYGSCWALWGHILEESQLDKDVGKGVFSSHLHIAIPPPSHPFLLLCSALRQCRVSWDHGTFLFPVLQT